ncbi:unnamed protein product [Effrenium voratum]|uniref:Ion transport domain-containing protein n=1 Tax=Effrenium voratum TaxID=2562239 RepID=A0AA36JNX3_9DINO|nr:unnamed protein product [Effrenium voratum]
MRRNRVVPDEDSPIAQMALPEGQPPAPLKTSFSLPTETLPGSVPTRQEMEPDEDKEGLLEGLQGFRASMAGMQTELMRRLDMELKKVERRASSRLKSQAKKQVQLPKLACEMRDDTPGDLQSVAEALGRSQESADSPDTCMAPDSFGNSPALDSCTPSVTVARDTYTHSISVVSESAPGLSVVPSSSINRSSTDVSHHLPSLQRKRRKRMTWINKSARQTVKEQELEEGDDPDAPQVQRRLSTDKLPRVGFFPQLHSQASCECLQKEKDESMRRKNICWRIVKNPNFDRLTMLIIFLNAVTLAISAEQDEVVARGSFLVIADNVFCMYFLVELAIRCATYVRTLFAFQDMAFTFDFLLLVLMIWETWVMPIVSTIFDQSADVLQSSGALRLARILRVLRTARMARLVRQMPELMILIKGMMLACRSVFFTLLLLLIITFTFAIAFVELSHDTALKPIFFSSTAASIYTLILQCIFPDQQVFVTTLASESVFMGVLVLLFILLGSLTIMNMLLGVLVEAVKTVSTMEREQLIADFAKNVLWKMIRTDEDQDQDGDRMISEEEFTLLFTKPDALKALGKLGVDPTVALEYGKLLFEDGEIVTFTEFMHAMLTLRGSNTTTVKDVVELRKFVGEEFLQLQNLVGELCSFIAEEMNVPPRLGKEAQAVSKRSLKPGQDFRPTGTR